MPTYSLLEAKTQSDAAIAAGNPVEIKQVSENRFELLGVHQEPKHKFSKSMLFIGALIASLLLGMLLFALLSSESRSASLPSASPSMSALETLDQNQLSTLVSEGALQATGNDFVEVKRIELGGYLTVFLNQTFQGDTYLVRLDLIKQDDSWQIEKWVRLE